MKDRTIERGRGCWNCKSFENDKVSRQRWRECRMRDVAYIRAHSGELITKLGAMEDPTKLPDGDARYDTIRQMDQAVIAGAVGLCMIGKVPTDFVHHQYLCSSWTGKQGSSVATSGHKLDKLPDELRDMVDSMDRKRRK